MASSDKQNRPKARLAKGFRDVDANEIRGLKRMLRIIEGVYENYGFEPVEQPFIEYTEALGKFLPDQDRPNEGVFSFQDDDEQWLSLRYDLTAPLARYVAENQQFLPTPFRSYRQGWVFRNEKPGPGRYRQFMQFDADTVGSASPGSRRRSLHDGRRYDGSAGHSARAVCFENEQPQNSGRISGSSRHQSGRETHLASSPGQVGSPWQGGRGFASRQGPQG